ncbi:mitochondrial dicarboxylate carrier-related [Holotrichia oblita]|uniref:Mitochondrial dicarboxylate carrier-related n=2 Tax=Holotrichia oblita TaxID=644536 RepID=A0ACB9TB73_HOLOL|nr:mitochondrial dicarboxylate carrier-related [Holotrichia oblita]KAI4464024.1 mitochondrial dicarboxylate carrier-related [Holotrichia oblita]
MEPPKTKRISRWYFGGCASAGAACITHPLDLIKVLLQTQQERHATLPVMVAEVVRTQGIKALYNGISASVLRQMTYSLTRFGIYEYLKNSATGPTSFLARIGMASVAGAAGGFIGTPADLINVRMQNDVKLPPDHRRNYKHAIDGLFRVLREEGIVKLFSGASMATSRAIVMTVGQLSTYDQIKMVLLTMPFFTDTPVTHFTSSILAASIATTLTQPLDVMKTRAMNAKPGEYTDLFHIFVHTAKLGPLGFFKGYVPAFVRLGPQTVLTFIFFEQLRLHFGIDVPVIK